MEQNISQKFRGFNNIKKICNKFTGFYYRTFLTNLLIPMPYNTSYAFKRSHKIYSIAYKFTGSHTDTEYGLYKYKSCYRSQTPVSYRLTRSSEIRQRIFLLASDCQPYKRLKRVSFFRALESSTLLFLSLQLSRETFRTFTSDFWEIHYAYCPLAYRSEHET